MTFFHNLIIAISKVSMVANVRILIIHNYLWHRFEPDMLAFSGCYFGGGEKERQELGEIRKRWTTLPVRLQSYHFY
jgi:hypothetical protein